MAKTKTSTNQNLLISLAEIGDVNKKELQSNITDIIAKNATRTDLIRLNVNKNSLDYNFLVLLKDYNSVNEITNDLTNLDSNISITFIDSQNMTI